MMTISTRALADGDVSCPMLSDVSCPTMPSLDSDDVIQTVPKRLPHDHPLADRAEMKGINLTLICAKPDCLSNPCLHGSTCTETYDGYECLCSACCSGNQCQDCLLNPCLHGSTCKETFDGYECLCSVCSSGNHCQDKLLKDCSEIYATGERISGVYTICPGSNVVDKEPIDVYCNIDEAGGWLVFQRRQDGTVDFYQNWAAYKNGFGDLEAEFWLGNDIIHRITYQGDYTLRIYMVDLNGQSLTALYNNFRVANESEGYRLKYLTYNATSSNAGDAMIFHNGHQFTTLDRDRDGNADENCAILYKGGWWYNGCYWANLNGLWSNSDLSGMSWNQRSLRDSTMEIKAP
eukprot:XP_011677931.1 PREDICTED: ficolin-3-like [Strongylocentrotus purpuratus]